MIQFQTSRLGTKTSRNVQKRGKKIQLSYRSHHCPEKSPNLDYRFIGGALIPPLSLFADLWGIQYIMNVSNVSKTEAATAIAMLVLRMAYWKSYCRLVLRLRWSQKSTVILERSREWLLSFRDALSSLQSLFFPLCITLHFWPLLCSSEVVTFVAGFEANQKYLKGTAMAL